MDAGKISFTMCLCKDNSAFIKEIDTPSTDPKCTLYPPPSAQLIKKLVYSSRLDRYIILLSSSTICIYRTFRETALLEAVQDPHEIKDCELKKALSQDVTSMELVVTRKKKEITAIDSEVVNKKLHTLSFAASNHDRASN
jgi:hypothetical protein